MNKIIEPNPEMAAVLMTYQCVAQCDECCFSCGPHLQGTSLTFDKVKYFLDQIKKIPSIKIVVFSGGECFIEFSLLVQSIKYASDLGLMTRCVTNGFWGKSLELARKKVASLHESGLTEINFSTGDSHQQYIPVENVLNATIAATENEITTCISVESNKSKKFKANDFINHPLYQQYIANAEKEKYLQLLSATWVSFHTDTIYQYDESVMDDSIESGCEGIFDTIALEPRGDIMVCCGLTVNNIEEFHLGKLENSNLKEIFEKHHNDFLKIWIFLDGPKKIVEVASKWLGEKPPIFAHKCLYCAYLYNNKELLNVIKGNYYTLKEDVLSRYTQKMVIEKAMS